MIAEEAHGIKRAHNAEHVLIYWSAALPNERLGPECNKVLTHAVPALAPRGAVFCPKEVSTIKVAGEP